MGRTWPALAATALAVWAVVGCRQENPDWRGPVAGTDTTVEATGTSTGSTSTSSTSSTTTSSPGSSSGAFTCEDPALTLCESECVDLLSNDQHCGECRNRCVGNRTCVDGNCEK